MKRDVIWVPWSDPGLEHLHLVQDDQGVLADGLIVGMKDNTPFRARYTIRCDAQWKVRAVSVDLFSGNRPNVRMTADGEGHWAAASGDPIPALDGCVDVDISATPFTNTLPIRRLGLKSGEASDLLIAYVSVPEMEVSLSQQRYTCLSVSPGGGRYRFEAKGFVAELEVDADGLVLDYPELFRRVWTELGNKEWVP